MVRKRKKFQTPENVFSCRRHEENQWDQRRVCSVGVCVHMSKWQRTRPVLPKTQNILKRDSFTLLYFFLHL